MRWTQEVGQSGWQHQRTLRLKAWSWVRKSATNVVVELKTKEEGRALSVDVE